VALFSRRRLPAAERPRLDLRPGDAVLVGVALEDERWAVASRRALHVLVPGGQVQRNPWSDVDRGSLDAETRTLTVRWVWGEEIALVFPEGSDARAFAQTFRERVQQSVVHAATVTVPAGSPAAGQQVRVALRRDEEGDLFTQVLGAVDLADPVVAAAVDEAEEQVRDAAGLPR